MAASHIYIYMQCEKHTGMTGRQKIKNVLRRDKNTLNLGANRSILSEPGGGSKAPSEFSKVNYITTYLYSGFLPFF